MKFALHLTFGLVLLFFGFFSFLRGARDSLSGVQFVPIAQLSQYPTRQIASQKEPPGDLIETSHLLIPLTPQSALKKARKHSSVGDYELQLAHFAVTDERNNYQSVCTLYKKILIEYELPTNVRKPTQLDSRNSTFVIEMNCQVDDKKPDYLRSVHLNKQDLQELNLKVPSEGHFYIQSQGLSLNFEGIDQHWPPLWVISKITFQATGSHPPKVIKVNEIPPSEVRPEVFTLDWANLL